MNITLASIILVCFVLTVFCAGAREIANLRLTLYRIAKKLTDEGGGWALETVYSWKRVVTFHLHLLLNNRQKGTLLPLIIEQSLREADRFPVLFHHTLAENPDALMALKGPTLKMVREDFKASVEAVDDKFIRINFTSRFVANTTLEQLTNIIFMLRDELDKHAGTSGELNSSFYRYPIELSQIVELPKQIISTKVYVTFFTALTYAVFVFGAGLFVMRFVLHRI